MVVPYSTCESEDMSVVQVMVTPLVVMLVAWILEMTGKAEAAVVKVASEETEVKLPESDDSTW